jgi:hypothetical protein
LEEKFQEKELNLQKIKKEVYEAETLTFQPKINKTSRVMTEYNDSRQDETKEEKINRLYSYVKNIINYKNNI